MALMDNVKVPTFKGPNARTQSSGNANPNSNEPGPMRKKSAPNTNIAFRLIQPAFHGDVHPARAWWLNRPSLSLRKVAGTSSNLKPRCADLSTISEAYSHDCDASSILLNASIVNPRIPQ